MGAPQPLDAHGVDLKAGLTQQLVGEQPAAHADLAVDAPDRKLDAFAIKRGLPGEQC